MTAVLLREIYSSKMMVSKHDKDLYNYILEEVLPEHPGVPKPSLRGRIPVVERDGGTSDGERYVSFTLAMPITSRIRDIVGDELKVVAIYDNFLPSHVVVFPDSKYLFFVRMYYVPEQQLMLIQEALNPKGFFGDIHIHLKLDHDSRAFMQRFDDLTKVSRLQIVVKTQDNPGLRSWRRSNDAVANALRSNEYAVDYRIRRKGRKKNDFLDTDNPEVRELVRDVAESKQADLNATGIGLDGLKTIVDTKDHYQHETVSADLAENNEKLIPHLRKLLQSRLGENEQ